MANPLRTQLRKQILASLRLDNMARGEHVPEKRFAALGTSRGPVRAAMAELAEEGVLEYRANKGYFVIDLSIAGEDGEAGAEESTYRAIAADRLSGDLPETVMINEIARRYDVSRPMVLRIMGRIEREGWASRRAGRGYAFTAMVDTPDAYREIYEMRRAIEPAGILAEAHVTDLAVLESCRKQQIYVLDNLGQVDQGALFAIQSAFHESVMTMSGNRFFLQTLQRLNSLRRLATYRQELDIELVRQQSTDHVAIIDALMDQDRVAAAEMMREHLGGEKRSAVLSRIFSE